MVIETRESGKKRDAGTSWSVLGASNRQVTPLELKPGPTQKTRCQSQSSLRSLLLQRRTGAALGGRNSTRHGIPCALQSLLSLYCHTTGKEVD